MPSGPFTEFGLPLIANGYGIVPIQRGRKAPAIDGWQSNYATSAAQWEALVAKHPRAGVGIVTKHAPAVDIDCLDQSLVDHMIQWCFDNLGDAPVRVGNPPKALLLYTTGKPFAKVTSARFYDPEHPELDPKRKGQRLEVLGDGQQFVAYAIHPDTGKPYQWTTPGQDPLNVDVFSLVEITEAHARAACREFERVCEGAGWERLGSGSESRERTAQERDDPADAMLEIPPPDETDEEIERVRSALDAMKENSSDYDYDEWRNVLFALRWTQWECAESLAREWSETSDKHVTKTFNVVWRGAQKRDRSQEITLATLYSMAKGAGWDSSRRAALEDDAETYDAVMQSIAEIEFENSTRKAVQAIIKRIAEMKLSSAAEGHLLRAIKDETGDGITDLRRDLYRARKEHREAEDAHKLTHAGYAEKLVDIMTEKAGVKPVGVEGAIQVYNGKRGIYEPVQINDFSIEVAKHFDGLDNCSRRNDYLSIANHFYSLIAAGNEEFFAKAPVGLACKNGKFYRVKDGKIESEPLDHTHRQRFVSPVSPKVKATPRFTKFLDQVFAGADSEGQMGLLQEAFGGALLGITARLQKAILLYGPGRSGKGTILRILELLLPREVISAVPPDKWVSEYYLATLAAKLANIVGELSDENPIPGSVFKAVTGGDLLTGRHPTHRPFTFHCNATHIFNSNYFPPHRDHGTAFAARWVTIGFSNSLIGKDAEIDPLLVEKMVEDGELAGILAWFMRGAERLQKRGRFQLTRTHHMLMAQWQQRSNSVVEFMLDDDVCEIGEGAKYRVRRSAFYEAYAKWCRESNRKPIGKQKLYDELRSDGAQKFGISGGFDSDGNRMLRGIRLKGADWGVFEDLDDGEL